MLKDGTVVARLRAHGALLIGKLNMHEIGIQPNGLNVHHGQVRNPYNTAYDPGGSSSGSAAAVGAGVCPIAIGADGGGSVRIPAALCGVVGLKATYGRISEVGAVPLCWSVAHIGPLAATVEDTAIAYAAIAGPDADDPNTLKQPPPSLQDWSKDDLKGVTLGVYRPWFEHADTEVVRANDELLRGLKERGATVREIEIPELEPLRVAHSITILSEMAASMRHVPLEKFAASVRVTLAAARGLGGVDYVWAQRVRARQMAIWKALPVDAVITPATGAVAQKIPGEGDWSNLSATIKHMRFIIAGNLLGLPGIAFPAGYSKDGLPIAMHASGRAWEEHRLLRIAHVAECLVTKKPAVVHVDLLK